MTIAEKIIRAKEDYDAVHEAGRQEGLDAGGYNKGFEAGKQDEYDAFWDAAQQNGTRVKYALGLCGDMWTKETFKPKYPIIPEGSMANCFAYWGINGVGKDMDLRELCVLDTSKATNMDSCFFNNKAVIGIGVIDFTQASTMNGTFNGAENLITIEKIIMNNGLQKADNLFRNCYALINISFEGDIMFNIDFSACTLLTKTSIESIVNHLSNDTEGKILTLSKTAVDEAFAFYTEINGEYYVSKGTDEDNPYWWPLRAKKTNWEIVYSQ